MTIVVILRAKVNPSDWRHVGMISHMEDQKQVAAKATLSQMTDEELLLEYRSLGDDTTFAQLVRRYERELFNYLRRYLGDAVLAEDTFQKTFLQIHLKCDQFQEGRKFRPWLYTIATNQAIDAQRRNRRHKAVSLDRRNSAAGDTQVGTLVDLMASSEPGPEAQFEAEEREAWVRQALEELPEQLKSAVTLIYFQGLKYREAAEILSIPVGTVKSRLHSAILKLNEAWRDSHTQGS